uniref:C1q domain-containing protein n=1 Tax=Magallana gigas TaxID=29159 RepID=A0A8W8JAC8_MAGGI
MATSNASSDPDIHMSDDVLFGEASGEQLSNDDAVPLFNCSLRKALQQQNEVIVSSIVKQLKSQLSKNRANRCEEHEESAKDEIAENLNRTVARFDVQFTLSEHTQQNFSSALVSLETAQTKLSKSIDDKNKHHAFTAGISSSNYGWTGSTLVFPLVIYSEGTGYNPSTGIFTAPTAGTYVFYVSVQSAHQNTIYLDIVLNGFSKVRAMAWYDSGSSVRITQTGTNLVILHLQTGDRVWVKRHSGTGYASHYDTPVTTFSGFKLN